MMKIVGVTALLAAAATPSLAKQINIIVTGTVWEGTDYTGTFGFAPNTDLTGQAYTLTFTFDDTKGTQGSSGAASYIESTSTSNPGTALLQIGGGSFSFGTTQYDPSTQSEAYMAIGGSNPPYGNSYALSAGSASYNSTWDDIQGTIVPATGTVLNYNTNWESPFTNSNLKVYASDNYSLFFGLDEEAYNLHASGYLTANTITINGPQSVSAPEPGTLAMVVLAALVFLSASLSRKRIGVALLIVLLAAAFCCAAQTTSDEGRPKKVAYNGKNYFVEQMGAGYALKITPEGTPVPIGVVDIRRDVVRALNPSDYDLVKGVYDTYKSGGATFVAPATPTGTAVAATHGPISGGDRSVKFSDSSAIVTDPRYGEMTISNDGTQASYITQGHGVSTVPTKVMVTYEGGASAPSASEKAGKFLKGGGSALAHAMSPRIVTRVGTSGNDVWKVVGEGVRGKNTIYESGSKAVGMMADRDAGQDIGLTILESVKEDIAAAQRAAETKKAAGEPVKFDLSSERSQRAGKSLEEATKAYRIK